jgi:hypothetical protein
VNLDRFWTAAATSRDFIADRAERLGQAGRLGVTAAVIVGASAGIAAVTNNGGPVPLPVAAAYSQTAGSTAVTKANADVAPHAAITTLTPAAKVSMPPAAAKVAVPPMATLLPHGVGGGQQNFPLSAKQRANAAAIVKAGQLMKLPPRAMVLAVQCAMQESTLHNYGNLGAANDHDSQGLFQQRPSSGWGTPAQVTNPVHAAESFLHRLIHVPGWQHMPATLAIQAVQVSAFPQAYAKWEKFAASVVASTYAADAAHAAAAAAGK